MNDEAIEGLLRNVDVRLTRVEQYLPSLATREELQAAIAPLPTREELHTVIQTAIDTAIAPLATREELHTAIQAAIAPLATRKELHEGLDSLRSQMMTLIENQRDDTRIVLEHLVALSARVDALARP